MSKTIQKFGSLQRTFSLAFGTVLFAGLVLCGEMATGQNLQLRYTFEDTGTTAASDDGGALNVPLTLLDFTGAATDLHGAASSGVQNQGHSLNLSSAFNFTGPQIRGPIAQATNNAVLGTLGVVSNFTVAVWFKEDSIITNTSNIGGRLFLIGTNGMVDQTSATTNVITMWFQTTNALQAKINNSVFSAPLYFNPLPTNVWLFAAITYDGTNNVRFYYGTEASPAKLVGIRSIGAQSVDFGSGGGAGNILLGNRSSDRVRAFDGWIDEFRFYTGAGDDDFIENIRRESTPVVVSDLYPDGMTLMQGTDTLSFAVSSANGIDPSGIKVAVNGADVSSSLVIGGSANSRTVSYTGLPVNPTLVSTAPFNAVKINIQITDAGGITTSNIVTYDAFSPDNFTWEAEDYDFGGGMYIDNPRYAFESASDTYWQQAGVPPIDYSDTTAQNDVFRSVFDLVATEFSVGVGANGGPSVGELMRQKIRDALALDSGIRDVDVGNFDSGDWINFTRTFPSGAFNVYTRAANGGSGRLATLSRVTDGWGTAVQTTTNLGTFTIPNTGGWESYAWVPLRDAGGNLVRVNLDGTNTLRLTAGSGGGGNNNFLMLTPANTNLPVISGVYPNGTNMFQSAANFSFVASSPVGVAINPSGISVTATITTVSSTTVTNFTSANGLILGGTETSRTVSMPLVTNATYSVTVNITDANGSPASTTVKFDTYNPAFTWEAEDYDYNGGQFIDNPAPNAYSGFSGTADVDYHDSVTVSQNGTPVYRTADPVGLEINGDSPKRVEYIGTGFTDYDVGWYDTGNWNNYTRTFPAGLYNVYLRAANGSGGNGGITLSQVTSGQGTASQTTADLGSFTIPATGNWQGYTWVPLRDSGGNLVKFTGGSLETLRATSSGGVNANFYALFPANTNLPVINDIYPDGTALFQQTNRFSFTVSSAGGISTNNIRLNLNGSDVSGVVFSGSSAKWNVSYSGLTPNAKYTAVISVTDNNGNPASTTISFDTFASDYYTWEAEDYDYGSGQYFDNPQVDSYSNLDAVVDVDYHGGDTGGAYLYRSGIASEIIDDGGRPQFAGKINYDIGNFGAGKWGNYTRHFPDGTYNVWGRFACGDPNQSSALLSIVTSGWGTTTQTTNLLGAFMVPTTGWSSFGWVEMTDSSGNPRTITLTGSTNTLKLTRDPTAPFADVNVDFLMLVPVVPSLSVSASINNGNIVLSFATQANTSYQVEYKDNLTDANWTSLGDVIAGDGTTKSATDSITNGKRFYRVHIQ